MKKKYFVLAIILIAFCNILQAQTSKKISGNIVDANKKRIEGAIVSLLSTKNNGLLKTVITDSTGKFGFLILKTDTFIITASSVEKQKYTSNKIAFGQYDEEIILPEIVLQNNMATELNQVNIVAQLPFVQKKIDRTVVNPDALIGNAGTNALEVLEKSPGVQVDVNGNISLQGKQGVMIFIDDKPTYLAAADLANYLKSLPSSTLDLIEIMTNPPAKYDAAGNAGIINIKLKRVIDKGFNGSVNTSFGQGKYSRSNNSINFNYRINKVNFFSNVSYNNNNSYQDLSINRTYFDPNGSLNSLFNQKSLITRNGVGANVKLGFDYYMDKKSTFGMVLTGFSNVTNSLTANDSKSIGANQNLQNVVIATSPSERTLQNGSLNLNYAYKIDKTGSELTANADYLAYNTNVDQNLLSTSFLPSGALIDRSNLISNLPAKLNIMSAKVDYLKPLKNGARFEAGLKSSLINTNNLANFFDETNNVSTINYTFSNNFKYRENINATYINYSLQRKRFGLQAGLRLENTIITGNQLGNPIRKDSTFTRNYSNLFPTFYLSYNLDSVSKNQLGFSYGRRINRPNYQDMNPFTYPLDKFTLYAGNPFLQPTFSNNFELSHTYKNNFTTTLQYSYLTDAFNETIEQRGNIFFSRPGNIGTQITYGVSINGALVIKKWWTMQLYTELMNNTFKGNIYNQTLNNSGTYWVIAPTNQFKISKTWSAEFAGTYQTSVKSGQFITIPVWTTRAGVSKKILKDKGTIRANVSDLFYTNQPGGDIVAIANSNANFFSYLDSRVATIAFSYRFNKGKNLAVRNSGAADTEKSRIK